MELVKMVGLELFAPLITAAPLAMLFVVTFLAMALVFLVLRDRGSPHAFEASVLLGVAVFIVLQLAFGLIFAELNIVMLAIMLPLLIKEALLHCKEEQDSEWSVPVQVMGVKGWVMEDALCFRQKEGFAVVAALTVTTNPFPDKGGEAEDADWLGPMMEETHRSGVAYTYEALGAEGGVVANIYAVAEKRDWREALGEVRRARQVAEWSLGRRNGVCVEVLVGDALFEAYRAQVTRLGHHAFLAFTEQMLGGSPR